MRVSDFSFYNDIPILNKNFHNLVEKKEQFSNDFNIWRIKKCQRLIEHFGVEWFKNKKILEIGCGFGNLGLFLKSLGSNVTFNDARDENLNEVLENDPSSKIYKFDCEKGKPLKEYYDLIVDFGVLYNLNYWEKHLSNMLNHCNHLALDTAVNKYEGDVEFKIINYQYSDKLHGPFSNIGTLTSAYNIENIFKRKNFNYMRYDNENLNSDVKYDWIEEKSFDIEENNIVNHWGRNIHFKGNRYWIASKEIERVIRY